MELQQWGNGTATSDDKMKSCHLLPLQWRWTCQESFSQDFWKVRSTSLLPQVSPWWWHEGFIKPQLQLGKWESWLLPLHRQKWPCIKAAQNYHSHLKYYISSLKSCYCIFSKRIKRIYCINKKKNVSPLTIVFKKQK